MKRITTTLLAAVLAVSACSDSPTDPTLDVEQTTSEAPRFGPSHATDAAGLQAALDRAAASDRTSLVLIRGTIELDEPLVYDGPGDVQIVGVRDARLVGPMTPIDEPSNSGDRVGEPTVGDALQVFGGGNLAIRNVDFYGSSGHGIYLEVPAGATGQVSVDLNGVDFDGQGLSGVWIEEQESAAGPINSAASLHLALTRVEVTGTGFATDEDGGCPDASEDDGCGWADFDGMRINEGGDGDITFRFRDVVMTGNAGDGIEFDEKGEGHVTGSVQNARFDENGSQPQFPEDLEDGFDIDEAGGGSIDIRLLGASISGNIDEGLDLDEEGPGDIRVRLLLVRSVGNQDDNIKLSEDADLEDEDPAGETGGIEVNFFRVTADDALDGDGINLEEFGAGTIMGSISRSQVRGNADDGLQAEQVTPDGGPLGELRIRFSDISGNGDDDLNVEDVIIVP